MMIARRLGAFFSVQPGEGQTTALLLSIAFCNGLARTFLRSAAYGLFLAAFGAQRLPYVYIAVSVSAALASFAYLQLIQRVPMGRLLPGTLGVILGTMILLYLGAISIQSSWLLFVLPVSYEVLLVMTNLALWNTVGRLFNVQQMKRLSGAVSTGEPVASVVGGVLTAPLVGLLGTVNLILLAAVALVGALITAGVLTRAQGSALEQHVDRPAPERQHQVGGVSKNRYVLLTFALFWFALVSYYFIDNLFYVQTQQQFPSAAQLAGFLGLFNAGIAIVWTLTNAFVIGAVLRRFGLGGVLIVAPVALALSALAFVAASGAGAAILALFTLAAFAKLLSKLCFDGFIKVSLNIIYQPLPAHQRQQAQALTEGIVYASAIGIAGLLLLTLTSVLQLNALDLAIALLVLIFGWLFVAVLLLREYPQQLLRALARRRLGGADMLPLADPASQAVLRAALNDPQPGVALAAFQLLMHGDPAAHALLPDLLNHPVAEVRSEVLRAIEQHSIRSTVDAVHTMIQTERDPNVRGAAIRVFTRIGGDLPHDQAMTLLADVEPAIRVGTIVGMAHNADRSSDHEHIVRNQLAQWSASPEPATRLIAVRTIGEIGLSDFDQYLPDLLNDDDAVVRRAALVAAGQVASPRLWPQVIMLCNTRGSAKAAANALVAGGSDVLPATAAAFEHAGPHLRAQLAHIWGRIGGPASLMLLITHVDVQDPFVRTHVLRELARADVQLTGDMRVRLQQQVQVEVASATWALAALIDCDDTPDSLLTRALSAEVAAAQERLLYIASILGDRHAISRAREALASPSAEQRAYALEIIDTQIPSELKSSVIPLLSDMPAAQKLAQLNYLPPQPTSNRALRLAEIIDGAGGLAGPWTRACAIESAVRWDVQTLAQTLHSVSTVADPLLRETAHWGLAILERDKAQLVATTALASEGTSNMLSRIEKVLILKSVAMFGDTPDDVLADVAGLLHEIEAPVGTVIFEKGDVGTSMYIIVDGEVRVYDADHTLNHLYTHDVFGEMALLDSELRVASIIAVTDTRLLRLDQESFYELMDEHNEVARGVIRVLVRRLRDRVRDLATVRDQLAHVDQQMAPVAGSDHATDSSEPRRFANESA